MVKAILRDDKTQTRRKIKPQPKYSEMKFQHMIGEWAYFETPAGHQDPTMYHAKRNVNIGDVFWVRETFTKDCFPNNPITDDEDVVYYYKSSMENFAFPKGFKWKPSIFMPRAACRIFLEVIDVQAERLHEISESDALAEGVLYYDCEITKSRCFKDYVTKAHGYGHPEHDYPSVNTAKESFQTLWESINSKESWESNPYVWVYEFKKIDQPKEFIQ